MPKFLLAVFVKFRKNYFGEIQEEKGVGQKASHTYPKLLAERKKPANLSISSRFQAAIQMVRKHEKLDGYNPYHYTLWYTIKLPFPQKAMSPVYCR